MKLGFVINRYAAADTVAAAEAAERHGADSCWIAEDPWQRGAIPMASLCAARTERIRIGVGVINPYNRHPTLIAMDCAVLAEMFGDRVNIGIGSSVKAWIEYQLGLDYSRPRTALKEAVEIVRAMLAGEKVTFKGKVFDVTDAQLSFSVERPPPMYLAAMGPRTVHTCGAIGDGWVISAFEPVGYVRTAMEWLRAGAAEAGRDPDAIDKVQFIPFSCGEDSRAAKDAVKPGLGAYVAFETALVESQPILAQAMQGHFERLSQAEYDEVVAAINAGKDPVEVVPDELVDELAIAGTPQQCAELLRGYAAVGVKEVALLPFGPVDEAARIMGEELLPLVRDAPVGA